MLEGHDVQVVSTLPASMAPSMMIQHQLHMTLDTCPSTSGPHGELQLRLFNIVFSESAVDKAVDKLVSAAREGTLHVIMDEAEFVNEYVCLVVITFPFLSLSLTLKLSPVSSSFFSRIDSSPLLPSPILSSFSSLLQ